MKRTHLLEARCLQLGLQLGLSCTSISTISATTMVPDLHFREGPHLFLHLYLHEGLREKIAAEHVFCNGCRTAHLSFLRGLELLGQLFGDLVLGAVFCLDEEHMVSVVRGVRLSALRGCHLLLETVLHCRDLLALLLPTKLFAGLVLHSVLEPRLQAGDQALVPIQVGRQGLLSVAATREHTP